jgi:uncharacterized protein YerC
MDTTNITQISESNFVDLFSNEPLKSPEQMGFVGGGADPVEVDILANPEKKEEIKEEVKTEEVKVEEKQDVDIFEEKEKGKPGRKPKNDFSDLSGYFENRLNSGKFVAIEEETPTGEKKKFIPSTPEEFDEVIDLQVNYQLEKKAKDLEESWYKSKSPAWQTVAKYAEMTDDPAEIVPFIQGIKQLQDVSAFDANSIDGAEAIVRLRLQQRGDSEDIINEQIDALKTTDRLINTATKYKPLILKEQESQLKQELYKKEQEEKEWNQLVGNIREGAIKSIETPLFGKHKLKQEEKSAIFGMIGIPSQETKGYQIYSAIDKLFESGNFDTLKEVALLLTNKEAYTNYLSDIASTKTAESLQRKLRVATDISTRASSKSNQDDDGEEEQIVQRRTNYSGQFGR